MRVRQAWCGSALLLILLIAAIAATHASESSSASPQRRRYQRKVLVSRTPVTSTTPSSEDETPTPSTTQAALSTTEAAPSATEAAPSATESAPSAAEVEGQHPFAPAESSPAAPNAVASSSENTRATRSAVEAMQDRWARFVSDYARGANPGREIGSFPDWPQTPIKLNLPVAGERGRSSSVPVFVLPVPVPIRQECSADRDTPEDFRIDVRGRPPSERNPAPDEGRRIFDALNIPPPHPFKETQRLSNQVPDRPSYNQNRRPSYDDFDEPRKPSYDEPRKPSYDEPRKPSYDRPRKPLYDEPRKPSYDEPRRPSYEEPRRPSYDEPRRPSYDEPRKPSYEEPRKPSYNYNEPPPRPYEEPERPYTPRRPTPFSKPDLRYPEPSVFEPPNMHAGGPVDSAVLVQLFRAQQPQAPELPAVVTRHRRRADPPAPLPPAEPADPPRRDPPRPVFDRPMAVRGSLTVPRADYTEDYTAWYDPVTGNSRVELGDGATTTYRTMLGGQVSRVAMSFDRSGEQSIMRCSTMRAAPAAAADRAPPMLPNMDAFNFHGFVELDGAQAEMWKHTVSGRGEARGEALTYRHEMLLGRCNDTAKPLMYKVSVDSSVLGADSDGYVHRYHEVHTHQPDQGLFQFDLQNSCNTIEETTDMSVVEPLREFTMMERDTAYDDLFKEYSKTYERQYTDGTEEAVRKNLLMQTKRFVSAGNRLGATFSMALNFLSDRLQAEVDVLLGVVLDDEHFPAETFPHERSSLRDLADKLPDEFDWRKRGGVTPVKYQGSCSSCWAFAVAGAVEGALFRVTRRLVPLSEQCLVDCSQPYGGNGCKGTWPSHAYDYVQDRGIAPEKEYVPYMARVLQCQDKVVKPVTQISAHVNVTMHSVPALKVAIRKHAPSVVIIDSSLKSFQTYQKGVFYDDRCAKTKKKLKHAVLAVGWGKQRGEEHFILKNSWSAAWGEGGFIRVHGPSNTCGLLTLPSYPRLETNDVLRDLDPLAISKDNGGDQDDED